MERTAAIVLFDRLVAAHSKVERRGDTMPTSRVKTVVKKKRPERRK